MVNNDAIQPANGGGHSMRIVPADMNLQLGRGA